MTAQQEAHRPAQEAHGPVPEAHRPTPDGPHATRPVAAALTTATAVADLLADPERVGEVAPRALAALPAALMLPTWQPASLTLGHAGIALLHTRLARDDADRAKTAHAHLSAAVAAAGRAGPASAGDLLLPAQSLAGTVGGYTRLLERSVAVHSSFAQAHAARLTRRLQERTPGLSYPDYDVLVGLAGQGRALLLAAEAGHGPATEALAHVLRPLVALTRPVRVNGREVPGWWCAPERYVVSRDRDTYPGGDFNLGLAHGICGPLALLSLAHRAGHGVPGTRDAIRRIVDWVLSKRRQDAWGDHWPGRISYEEETAPPSPSGTVAGLPARSGWCYGTAGVAWTLHLAGQALRDPALTQLASAALLAALNRPRSEGELRDPGFCHGRAGMVHTGAHLAAETDDPELWSAVDSEARWLSAAFDSRHPFGYRQVVRDEAGFTEIDSPGLVDGAAGIALSLMSYADARRGLGPRGADWDAAFLMS